VTPTFTSADDSLCIAAYDVVIARNAVRWVASWLNDGERAARHNRLKITLDSLREVTARQDAQRHLPATFKDQ
jgi:hypothetical protein